MYIRSILNKVAKSGMTQFKSRVQKEACPISIQHDYQGYEQALNILELETLKETGYPSRKRESFHVQHAKTNRLSDKIKIKCFIY